MSIYSLLSNPENGYMEIRDIRLAALRAMVETAGGPSAFARLHNGVDPTYVSQLLNGHRNFGERAARSMEVKLGLAPGGLDRATTDTTNDWPFARLDKAIYGELKQSQRDAIEDWVIDQVHRFLGTTADPATTTKSKKTA